MGFISCVHLQTGLHVKVEKARCPLSTSDRWRAVDRLIADNAHNAALFNAITPTVRVHDYARRRYELQVMTVVGTDMPNVYDVEVMVWDKNDDACTIGTIGMLHGVLVTEEDDT